MGDILKQAEALIDQRERARFDKAEKVSAKDWRGEYVWSERFEEPFDSIEELIERHAEHGDEPPEYVWECDEEVLELDAYEILDNALERAEATFMMGYIHGSSINDLNKALEDWAKKNPVRWWRPAHKRAVLLREESP